MPASAFPVLVIGAGPTGLAAALTLAKNGIPLRVVDKAPEFHQMSRGSGIHARTMEVFQILGALEDLRSESGPLQPLRSYKLPGGTEVERTWNIFEPAPPTPDRPYGGVTVDQYLTESVLRKNLELYGVHVELATEPTHLEEGPEGVAVVLTKTAGDGSTQTETLQAAYVIGADGAKGITRKFIGATFEGQTKDADGGVWAECELEGDLSTEHRHLWQRPDKVIAVARYKIHGGFHVGIVGANFNAQELADPVKFENFFHELTGRKDLVFKKISWPMFWRPNMRMVNKMSEGRVFIAGDAAHVHSPTGGQGLNTSIQDSFNLGWKIALAYKGLASPALLASYNEERLPVVTQMLLTTTGLYTNLMSKTPGGLIPVGDKSNKDGFLQWKNRALSQLDVNYRYSSVVFDARGADGRSVDEMKALAYQGYGQDGGVRAGDRAPQAPGLVDATGKETSLFDIFEANTHTILLYATGADEDNVKIAEIVKQLQTYPSGILQVVVLGRNGVLVVAGGAVTYHDKDGHAARAYQVEYGTPHIVVVRPDGYIGAVAYDMDGVREYFSGVLKVD